LTVIDPLFGFAVQECRWMVGMKKALRVGRTIYISPAMMDLIRHAEGDELRRLLGSIPMVEIPEPPSMFGPLPMTTEPRSQK
jgi:hypothetical protein